MNDPNQGNNYQNGSGNFVPRLLPTGQEAGSNYPQLSSAGVPSGHTSNYLPMLLPNQINPPNNPLPGNLYMGPPIVRPHIQSHLDPGAMICSKEEIDYWHTLNDQQKLYLISTQQKFARLNLEIIQYKMRGGIPSFSQRAISQTGHQSSPQMQTTVDSVAPGSNDIAPNQTSSIIVPPMRPSLPVVIEAHRPPALQNTAQFLHSNHYSPQMRTELARPSQNVAFNFLNGGYNPLMRAEDSQPHLRNFTSNSQSVGQNPLNFVHWNTELNAQIRSMMQSRSTTQHQTQLREQSLPQQAKSLEMIDLTSEDNLTTKDTTDHGQVPVADKRKLIDADGNEHVYPTVKRQESSNDFPSQADAQFSKSSKHHLSVLVRLASLYTQKLNALGCQQLVKSDSGETISDEGWENQHRSYLVSALFCLETAARFIEKLRSVPNAFELLQMSSSHGDKFEIQLRIKLSMLLLNYTNSYRRAEFHLIQALALSQKNFSPKEHFYGVKMQLANLYARIGSLKHAESSLKDYISEAQSLGLKDWAYAMSFQLVNLPRYTQPAEILSKLHNMAFVANDYGMMAVASLKAVLHHLKQQNLATLASQLPKLKEWFESSNDSNVAALKPCFYLLDTLHMIMSGDFSNRKDRTSSLQALVDTWNSLPEESEFQFKFSLASQIPDQPASAPVQLRFCWMSRRQMMALLYFISGLLLKPSANTLFGAKALSQTVESAINNFKSVPGGLFIPGYIERRQSFYVRLIILSRLHLSDFYIAREDFQAAHQIIHNAVDLCSQNGLWDKFGPLALHTKGQLAQSQSQFASSFLFYKSALELATDRSLKVTIAFNVLMLAIPDHANPSPKLANIFEAIQAACPEPRLIPVESGIWLFSAIFANTMIAKKNYLSRALSLSKLSLNDQSIYLLNVLSAVLFAATNPETAEKILTQLLRSQQNLNMDIGAITASTILCKLSESKADQAGYNVNKSILEKCVASYQEKCKITIRN